MMASVILVVGFMGMIQATTIGAEMLATARRQTIAAQILTHEIEKLRLKSWSYVSSQSDAASATYTSDLTALNTAITSAGVTFLIAYDYTDVTTDLREITITVSWTKAGSSTAASTTTGSWLQQIAFRRDSPISRTYTRKATTWIGKYGLNAATRRS